MNGKTIIKEIKSKNSASNSYVFVQTLAAIGTTLLTVLLIYLYGTHKITPEKMLFIGAGVVLLQAAKAIVGAVGIWRAHRAAYGALTDIRLSIIQHLKKLPLGFFQRRRPGELSDIIHHDVEQIELYLAHTQPEIVGTMLIALLITGAMFIIDWRLALCMLAPVPLAAGLLILLFTKIWTKRLKQYNQSTKEMSEDLMEYVAVIPTIKAFSTEEHKTEALITRVKDYTKNSAQQMLGISAPNGVVQMIMEAGVLLVAFVGMELIVHQDFGITRFILALMLSLAFAQAVLKFMGYEHALILLNRCAANIASITGESPAPDYPTKPLVSSDITFDHVTFSYDEREQALHDVNVVFKRGTVNAIVGASGSGKSTIANLILGFWLPGAGRVSIGDRDVSTINERDLTGLISIVQQESFLFNTSIAENIGIGRAGAGREEIIEAAKKACIHDLIESLPNGYDTVIGEGGVKLSGGEKQRIAIARVLLKNTPVIILDEATAAIDPYNEHLIQQAITNLSRGKTLIVIAHHLSSITGANQIVVMDKGKVIAVGKHDDLRENCPLYAEMVQMQNEVDSWNIK
ncbi:MAG: putative multidrug export ATP-binding/permease protein [Candidatus Ordinivivax streblomastigis]|uniref:Putative multidrug export ATP-binding/permease protein n=1 Tax=Candidatus Ordinivivax streblomastigis TaxID=2540710 RepID=A0A5M8NXJ3_9BACT|nr:MAG: putative multidrug export ATP-binding/permease protein [Candidatus Ordinivivax streblomastigis]